MLDEEEALSLLKAVFNRSNDSKKLTYTGMKKSALGLFSQEMVFCYQNCSDLQ